MSKPAYSNLRFDFWLASDRSGIAQHSFCLYHDTLPIGSQILDALNELKGGCAPARLTLTFTPCSRPQPLTALRLILVPKSDNLQVMNIRRDSQTATIEMTDLGLGLVIKACTAWLSGAEDFCVSPRNARLKRKLYSQLDLESGELWFWGPYYGGP